MAVVGKTSIGGEAEVIGLLSLQVEFVEVALSESHVVVVAIDGIGLGYESRVDVDSPVEF